MGRRSDVDEEEFFRRSNPVVEELPDTSEPLFQQHSPHFLADLEETEADTLSSQPLERTRQKGAWKRLLGWARRKFRCLSGSDVS